MIEGLSSYSEAQNKNLIFSVSLKSEILAKVLDSETSQI